MRVSSQFAAPTGASRSRDEIPEIGPDSVSNIAIRQRCDNLAQLLSVSTLPAGKTVWPRQGTPHSPVRAISLRQRSGNDTILPVDV
jgi:hypothetical protein